MLAVSRVYSEPFASTCDVANRGYNWRALQADPNDELNAANEYGCGQLCGGMCGWQPTMLNLAALLVIRVAATQRGLAPVCRDYGSWSDQNLSPFMWQDLLLFLQCSFHRRVEHVEFS